MDITLVFWVSAMENLMPNPAWTQLRYEDATRAVTDVVELNPLVLRALASMGIFAMKT